MRPEEPVPAETIAAWQRGEEVAARAVFDVYYPRAFRLAVLSGMGVEAAKDCAQDAFVQAFERRRQLRDPQAFSFWFHRIATRHILDTLERRQRGAEVGLDAAAGMTEDWQRNHSPQPDELALIAEQRADLWDNVQTLPPRYRVALVLRYYGDFPLKDVASMLGMREGTLRVTIHRALQQLRQRATCDPAPGALAPLAEPLER